MEESKEIWIDGKHYFTIYGKDLQVVIVDDKIDKRTEVKC
jgi:ABC-type branched-subunit amino acid transport system substrate-binding protein